MNLNQFLALVRLRMLLTVNQIKKAGISNSILFIIIGVALVLFAVSSFIGALTFGVAWVKESSAGNVLFAWSALVIGFLFMWGINVVGRVQQNNAISIEKLLHLPITFHGAFFLNFLSTFFNFTYITFVPLMIGLAIAMPIARGWPSAVAIPLTLSFLFMVTAITYQFRNWLAAKMENKRTRGILMTAIPILFVVIYISVIELSNSKSVFEKLSQVGMGWLPSGVASAQTGNWHSGALGSIVMTAIGCVSLFFAYKTGMRKFTGASVARASQKDSSKARKNWIDSRMFAAIPGVSNPVAGIALGTMQSVRRAPEVYAALVPLLALAIFGTPYLIGKKDYVIPTWSIDILPLGLISVAMLGFPAFLFSSFSYIRDGFRAYILSPVPRNDILFGINLAMAIPTMILGWITMIILQCFVPVGAFWFLGNLIALPACFLLLCIVANLITVFFPVGLKRGSMTPVNSRVIPVVMLYLGVMLGPFVALLPAMVVHIAMQLVEKSMGWPMGWLYLILTLVLLLVSWLVYRKSLVELGNWLWKKEPAILDVVANIPE